MKVAIVYYSMSKNTEFAAQEIAVATDADLIPIEPVKAYPSKGMRKFIWGGKSAVMKEEPELMPYVFDADKYDAVVIGCPVWASSPAPPIRTFIKENLKALSQKRLAAFVCCGGGGAAKAFSKMRAALDNAPLVSELILIDPKDKPTPDKIRQIRDFAETITKEPK